MIENAHNRIDTRVIFIVNILQIILLQSSSSAIQNDSYVWDDDIVSVETFETIGEYLYHLLPTDYYTGIFAPYRDDTNSVDLFNLDGLISLDEKEYLDLELKQIEEDEEEKPTREVLLTLFVPYDIEWIQHTTDIDVDEGSQISIKRSNQKLTLFNHSFLPEEPKYFKLTGYGSWTRKGVGYGEPLPKEVLNESGITESKISEVTQKLVEEIEELSPEQLFRESFDRSRKKVIEAQDLYKALKETYLYAYRRQLEMHSIALTFESSIGNVYIWEPGEGADFANLATMVKPPGLYTVWIFDKSGSLTWRGIYQIEKESYKFTTTKEEVNLDDFKLLYEILVRR